MLQLFLTTNILETVAEIHLNKRTKACCADTLIFYSLIYGRHEERLKLLPEKYKDTRDTNPLSFLYHFKLCETTSLPLRAHMLSSSQRPSFCYLYNLKYDARG